MTPLFFKFIPRFIYKCLIGCSIVVFGVWVLIKSSLLHEVLKSYVLHQSNSHLNATLKIGSVTGNFFNEIRFNQVQLFSSDNQLLLEIPALRYNSSIVNVMFESDWMSNAVFELKSPHILIKRFEDGTWNFDSILKQREFNNTNLNAPHQLKLRYEDLSVSYMDYKGFNTTNTLAENPYELKIDQLNGDTTIQNLNVIDTALKGILTETESVVTSNMQLILNKGSFAINAAFERIDPVKTSRYFIPIPNLVVLTGNIGVRFQFKNAPGYVTKNPFLIECQIDVEDAEMQFPFLNKPVNGINGVVNISKGLIHDTVITRQYPRITQTQLADVINALQQDLLIDENQYMRNDLAKLPPQQRWVKSVLAEPPLLVHFDSVAVMFLDRLATVDGMIHPRHQGGDLTINQWRLPPFNIEKLDIAYQKKGTQYHIDIGKGILNNAPLSGQFVATQVKHQDFQVQGNAKIENLNEALNAAVSPIIAPMALSEMSALEVAVSANKNMIAFTLEAPLSDIKILGQHIHRFSGSIAYDNPVATIQSFLYLNQDENPIAVDLITQDTQTQLRLRAVQVPLHPITTAQFDGMRWSELGNLNATLDLGIPLNREFKSNWLDHVDASGVVSIQDLPINQTMFKTIRSTFSHQDGNTAFQTFEMKGKNRKNELSFTGDLRGALPRVGTLQINNFDLSVLGGINPAILPSRVRGELSGSIEFYHPTVTQNLAEQTGHWLYNMNAHGELMISEFGVDMHQFDRLEVSGAVDQGRVKIENALLTYRKSQLKLNGNMGPFDAIDLNINPETQIDISRLGSIFEPLGLQSGIINVSGKVSNTLLTPNATLSLFMTNVTALNVPLDSVKSELDYQSGVLTLRDTEIAYKAGKINIEGALNGGETIFPFSQVRLRTVINQFDLNHIVTFFERGMRHVPTDNLTELTEVKGNNEWGYSVSLPKNSTILYQNQQFSDEILAFNRIATARLTNRSDLFVDHPNIESEVSGRIDVNYAEGNPLKAVANMTLTNGVLGPLEFEKSIIQIASDYSKLSYLFSVSNGKLNGTAFHSLDAKGTVLNNILQIDYVTLNDDRLTKKPMVSGTLPLSTIWNTPSDDGSLNIHVNLVDDELNMLAMLTPQIVSIQNQGELDLRVFGPIENVAIDGLRLMFNDTKLLLKNGQRIRIVSADIGLNQNQLSLSRLKFNWEQMLPKRGVFDNTFDLYGTITAKMLNLKTNHFILDVGVTMNETVVQLDKNSGIIGGINVEQLLVKGEYSRVYNESNLAEHITYPTTAARIRLADNGIKFNSKEKSLRLLPIPIEVDLMIGENVFLNAKSLDTGLFSGVAFDVTLEKSKSPIRISGTLREPIIASPIMIEEGVISLVNRNFRLLPIGEQKTYLNAMGVSTLETQNSIQFSPVYRNNEQESVVPIINLKAVTVMALTNTPNITQNTANQRHFLLELQGPLAEIGTAKVSYFNSNSRLANDQLSFVQTFHLDESAEISQQDELVRIMFPELDASNVNSPTLFESIGETQINYFISRELLRPVEREVAEKVGLEDLQINYNFGKELIQNNNVNQNTIGINAVKHITSKLMIQIKSDIDLGSQQQTSFSDYISQIELNYFLLKNLSLNYSNSKESTYQDYFKSKVSLRYAHEF